MKIRGIYTKLLLAGLFVVIISMITYGLESEIKSSSEEIYLFEDTFTQPSRNPFSFDLTPHSPIEIDSDRDFISLGFNGSGSETDPYIIEGYNITSTDLATSAISIRDTTNYFLIRNCYVETIFWGIYIINVAENTVRIINNTCSYSIGGIQITTSPGSTLTNNTCSNNSHGITLNKSPNSTLTNNICNNNDYEGLELDQTLSCTITYNTFRNNFYQGINIISSSSCLITFNLFQENQNFGLDINEYSEGNLIYNNTFIENSLHRLTYLESSSQAEDDGKKNEWYESETNEGNFWSDLGDDCKYVIDGAARSKDLFPLNRAETCPNPEVGSTLSIVLPIVVIASILAFVVPKYIIPYIRENDLSEMFVSWFHRSKGVLLGLFIGILFIAGGLVFYRGIIGYLWTGDVDSFLISGSIILSVAIILIIIWIFYRKKASKGVLPGLFIGILFIAGGLVFYRGFIGYLGIIFLISGSIMLSVAIISIIIWIFYRKKAKKELR